MENEKFNIGNFLNFKFQVSKSKFFKGAGFKNAYLIFSGIPVIFAFIGAICSWVTAIRYFVNFHEYSGFSYMRTFYYIAVVPFICLLGLLFLLLIIRLIFEALKSSENQ